MLNSLVTDVHMRWHDCVSYSEQLLSTKGGSDRSVREFLARIHAYQHLVS